MNEVYSIPELRKQMKQHIEKLRDLGSQTPNNILNIETMSIEELEVVRKVSLLHDLHKVFPGWNFSHYALASPLKEADAFASLMSRRGPFRQKIFTNPNGYLRYSLPTRTPVVNQSPRPQELFKEFKVHQLDELHQNITQSKLLSVLNEAKEYPYSSLKYHLLLTTALTELFLEQKSYLFQNTFLCLGTEKPENGFTIIGRCVGDQSTEELIYLWLDTKPIGGGNTKLISSFKETWVNIVGWNLGKIKLGYYVGTIHSWSTALATLEDGMDYIF